MTAAIPGFGAGGVSSAWLVAAKPTAVAVSVVTIRAPATQRRRKPHGVVRGLRAVFVLIWLVFVEVFMALIVDPATPSQ